MLCGSTLDRSDDILLIMLSRDAKAPTVKHYWAGAERVCTAIGDGGLDRLGDFISSLVLITYEE